MNNKQQHRQSTTIRVSVMSEWHLKEIFTIYWNWGCDSLYNSFDSTRIQ